MKKRVLCYGDSNTWGYIGAVGQRYDESIRWTGRLAAAMPECTVIEEGLNGRTSVFDDPLTPGANGMTYLEPCLKSHAPLDLVIISIGTNDLKVNVCGTPGGSALGVAALVEKTRQVLGADIPVLVISPIVVGEERKSMGPMWVLPEDICELSRQFPFFFGEIAKGTGCHLLDAQTVAAPGKADAVHMDEKSHAALAEAVEKKIREILF